MSALRNYFIGTGTWFFAWGIQSVIFAWLVTMVLHETPRMVGVAQMALMLPATILLLLGGSLADHYGGRRLVILGHWLAITMPVFLIVVMTLGYLSYTVMIIAAVVMGTAQAIVTPARDGLLALVAQGRIQRRVVQASMIQFGLQVVGFLAASATDITGAESVLAIQALALLIGIVGYSRLQVGFAAHEQATHPSFGQIGASIRDGYHSVRQSPAMSMVVVQNCAMGLFFMGSYIVTIPLIVREVYQGSSTELAYLNAANSIGLVITIMLLLKFGDIRRQGKALLLAQGTGCFFLAAAGLGFGFGWMVLAIFGWGICGGVAMTMSRTIMQEQAPVDQRARMMAFYAFSFMGSGPLGALLNGFLADAVGPERALMVASLLMILVVSIVSLRSSLWHLNVAPAQESR
ncbi:MAG: MFS transporter [Gammaproteobacteria bacterium]|nr:MFS transporter [Gammaproteobacteria bacterium]